MRATVATKQVKLIFLSLTGFCLIQFASAQSSALQRYQFRELHMGGEVEITAYSHSSDAAENAMRAAFAEFARLEQIMSDYRPDSEVRQLVKNSNGKPVKVSRDLFQVLREARIASLASGGAFDVTVGPLVKLWRKSRDTKILPAPPEIRGALRTVGFERVVLDPAKQTVTVMPGALIDLGGIAKGFACDAAMAKLKAGGIKSAMILAGGDILVSGPPPGEAGWKIDAQGHPSGYFMLVDQAISTSGDANQFVEIGGRRYSHIVSPFNGLGLTPSIQATVVAPRAVETDAFATALCVLGHGKGSALAKRRGYRWIILTG